MTPRRRRRCQQQCTSTRWMLSQTAQGGPTWQGRQSHFLATHILSQSASRPVVWAVWTSVVLYPLQMIVETVDAMPTGQTLHLLYPSMWRRWINQVALAVASRRLAAEVHHHHTADRPCQSCLAAAAQCCRSYPTLSTRLRPPLTMQPLRKPQGGMHTASRCSTSLRATSSSALVQEACRRAARLSLHFCRTQTHSRMRTWQACGWRDADGRHRRPEWAASHTPV